MHCVDSSAEDESFFRMENFTASAEKTIWGFRNLNGLCSGSLFHVGSRCFLYWMISLCNTTAVSSSHGEEAQEIVDAARKVPFEQLSNTAQQGNLHQIPTLPHYHFICRTKKRAASLRASSSCSYGSRLQNIPTNWALSVNVNSSFLN